MVILLVEKGIGDVSTSISVHLCESVEIANDKKNLFDLDGKYWVKCQILDEGEEYNLS